MKRFRNAATLDYCTQFVRYVFGRLHFKPAPFQVTWKADRILFDELAITPLYYQDGKMKSFGIVLNKRLRFSKQLCRQAILHEIAHVIAGKQHFGHGRPYKNGLRKIVRSGLLEENA